jgi:hypothetical protein
MSVDRSVSHLDGFLPAISVLGHHSQSFVYHLVMLHKCSFLQGIKEVHKCALLCWQLALDLQMNHFHAGSWSNVVSPVHNVQNAAWTLVM